MRRELTKKKIEEISVNKIENLCNEFSRLESHIDTNDKTASVDGKIIVRKHPTEKKEDILDYITVQVKGTQVQKLSLKEISFDVEIADLKNFLLFDGVIFFVVELVSNTQYRIFYNLLLPYDIHAILKNIKTDQKQKRIKLKKLEKKQFLKICNQFIAERQNQKGVKCIPNEDVKKLKDFKFTLAGNIKNAIKYLLNNDVYIKAYQTELKEEIISNKATICQINEHSHVAVYIGDEKYYDEFVIQHNKNGIKAKIGKGIYISNIGEHFIPKIDVKIQGNLYERIRDIKFLIAWNNYKRVSIGDSFFEIVPNEKNLENLKIIQKNLQEIATMFDYLGVYFDVDIGKLSAKDNETIATLVNAVIYNKGEITQSNVIQAINVGIANKNIAIVVFNDNGVQKVYNYFDLHKYMKTIVEDDKGEKYQVPCYNDTNADLWLMFCNFRINSYEEAIKQCDPSPVAKERCIKIYLEMLRCYDIKNNDEYLNTCIRTIEYLRQTYTDDISVVVNYYQTIKRLRQLSKEEKELLISLKNNTEDSMVLSCINIILDNQSDFEYYYDKLTVKQKEEFKHWPIYNLKK
ncbi:hypothetical protein [Ructibacterium gallinarum]|uniref:DUF4365 domain-containing protein n=1 Tax=Ructibacterium gallinarum TaxID=2779355 RepID=A0A9D5LZC3_9FIRM|nr:hypothetical protein [Ructibacterium gallinarum]MBE5039712.1 hypothetical protein [Ructibacterium gallinarum]